MAERRFVVEVERLDAEVLMLDGLDLARTFFTRDISARPGGYDSMVGSASPDKILDVDITTVNTVASQERCKWRRSAAPWWSMLGRVGGGLVDLVGVSADRCGWIEELAA